MKSMVLLLYNNSTLDFGYFLQNQKIHLLKRRKFFSKKLSSLRQYPTFSMIIKESHLSVDLSVCWTSKFPGKMYRYTMNGSYDLYL